MTRECRQRHAPITLTPNVSPLGPGGCPSSRTSSCPASRTTSPTPPPPPTTTTPSHHPPPRRSRRPASTSGTAPSTRPDTSTSRADPRGRTPRTGAGRCCARPRGPYSTEGARASTGIPTTGSDSSRVRGWWACCAR